VPFLFLETSDGHDPAKRPGFSLRRDRRRGQPIVHHYGLNRAMIGDELRERLRDRNGGIRPAPGEALACLV